MVAWKGRNSRLKIFAGSAVVTAVVTAGWLMAMGEIARASGGSECVANDCPTADRKAGFVAFFAGPVSFLLCGGLMMVSPFMRNASAITSKRVLSISRPVLRKQPKFDRIPVKGTGAGLVGFGFLTTVHAFGPHPDIAYRDKQLVLWASSRAELKRAVAVIERLSSEASPVLGPTP
ncbi:MAG: hypothetical protein HC844_06040 [Tabrizicola sp.]|nr:hypothetical protein [Tabrizicola sp.]